MAYLDLAELPEVFDRFWFWSARRAAPAWFKRSDYHGAADVDLATAVRDTVAAQVGVRPSGPIRLLTHLRYFGYAFNPVSFYYCFDAADQRVETIVAEITNTPWNERHAYVLPISRATAHGAAQRFHFDKQFHVSPFWAMDMQYAWSFNDPAEKLLVHMENWRAQDRVFDATLTLDRKEISSTSLARSLVRYPMMTASVVSSIYWQALRLWMKRTPFFSHPMTTMKSNDELAGKADTIARGH
jgi:DUF1365 family protein